MPSAIAKKLRIRDGMKLLTINAPSSFEKKIDSDSLNASTSQSAKDFQQIHWFVRSRAQMEKDLNRVLNLLKGDIICWIYYPKGSSGIQTDLSRDKGWEKLLKHENLQWISLISFDDTWSSFGMRLKTEADKKKEAKPRERPIFNYIDAAAKKVFLPEDLSGALKKNKKAASFFETLSFSNKKEYLEWIVTAKKEETRNERIKGTIERLEKKWKNPRNI